MKYFFALTFLIIFSFKLQAQSNFKPGYIVSLTGDTTKGYIAYNQWGQQRAAQLAFKDAPDAVVKYFGVSDINAFGTNSDEVYRAFTVSISKNTLSADELVDYADTSVTVQKVFLGVLVSGKKVSLYFYEDGKKSRYYFSEGNTKPVELQRYRYLNPADRSKIIEVKSYQRQLLRLATIYSPDNSSLNKRVQNVDYTEQGLKNIIIKINGETQTVKYHEAQSKSPSLRFFIGLAGNANAIKFKGNFFEPYGTSWSYMPQINAGLDISPQKTTGKIALRVEANFTASKAAFSYFRESSARMSTVDKFSFSRYVVGLNPQILYSFLGTANAKVFVAGGISWQYAFYSSVVNELHVTLDNNTTVSPGSINNTFDSARFQLTTKIGVTTKKLQFYGGYNPPIDLIGTIKGYQLNFTSYSAGINYLF